MKKHNAFKSLAIVKKNVGQYALARVEIENGKLKNFELTDFEPKSIVEDRFWQDYYANYIGADQDLGIVKKPVKAAASVEGNQVGKA